MNLIKEKLSTVKNWLPLFFIFMVYGNLSSTETNSPLEMELLVYNTHGLPAIFARDNPDKRFPEIGKLTQLYELSLLQEDFAHHKTLLKSLNRRSLVVRGKDSRSSLCLFCAGSGLTMISNLEEEWHLDIHSEVFRSCSGWLGGLNDCFANKGFQLALLESPLGNRFFVVNTHLDAGRSSLDREARATQLKQITDRLRQEAAGEALIIAGDLNLDWEDPEDKSLLEAFIKDLGLIHSGKRAQTDRKWPILEYIFYRNGRTSTFEVLETGEDLAFQNDDGPLSDHPALFIKLLIY